MNRAKAIKLKCLDCASDIPKTVTVCSIVPCPLWPYRFGCSYKSKVFRERMRSAKRRYPRDYEVMVEELTAYIKIHPTAAEYVHIAAILEEDKD